jgi:hypothetical protein
MKSESKTELRRWGACSSRGAGGSVRQEGPQTFRKLKFVFFFLSPDWIALLWQVSILDPCYEVRE